MLQQLAALSTTFAPTSPLRVDLKVCEACGALWLRTRVPLQPGQPAAVYCRHCARRLASFPAPRGLRQPRRPRCPAPLGASLVTARTGGAR